jgi:hypothetical protein
MTERHQRVRGAQLVGSVALASAADVFRATTGTIGAHLKRLPDGETGDRAVWVRWLAPVLQSNPVLDVAFVEGAEQWAHAVLKEGHTASEVSFGELGYAREARESYEQFVAFRESGAIASDVRFQVSIPTPLAVSILFAPELWVEIADRWEEALTAEVARVTEAVPANDLAVQWDLCLETLMLEGAWPLPAGVTEDDIYAQVTRLGSAVTPEAELGFHFCYGDYEHQHTVEPKDMGLMVLMANRLTREIDRPVSWIHMPVPSDRDDDAFYAPLTELRLASST